jgi:glycosyltransferase involved in cell wall biosynthesis
MRKRFAQAMLGLVDLFLAPSQFLRQRYIDWGIPPERIRYEENGCALDAHQRAEDEVERVPRNRLGFFGQLTRFKGIHVLLEALKTVVADDADTHLWVHGTNLELQSPEFRKQVAELLVACKDNVTLGGRYQPQELEALMANVDWVVVPSIWWENSPLVIQEAFLYGKPVICGDIGGMGEKVTDGVNGLHFRARDPISLAQTLRRATTTPHLWDSLRKGIPDVYPMEEHVATLSDLYIDLLARKGSSSTVAVLS